MVTWGRQGGAWRGCRLGPALCPGSHPGLPAYRALLPDIQSLPEARLILPWEGGLQQ